MDTLDLSEWSRISAAIMQATEAVQRWNEALAGFNWQTTPELEVAYERLHIRHLLGYDDDVNAPAWVRRVHENTISTFGSGNGRVVR